MSSGFIQRAMHGGHVDPEAAPAIASATAGLGGDVEFLLKVLDDMSRGVPAPVALDQHTVLPTTDDVGQALGADTESLAFQVYSMFGLDPTGPFGKVLGGLASVAPMVVKGAKKLPRGVDQIDDALIVQHNMSQGNVRHADKMGGLPMPSIGIAKASAPIDGYGDVTLLGGSHMAKPTPRNPVYSADAYSPRYPSVETSLSDADMDIVQNFLLEPFDVKRTDYEKVRELPISILGFADDIESRGFEGLRSNRALQAKFLHERGELPDIKNMSKNDIDDVTQEKVNSFYAPLTDEYMNWVSKLPERLDVTPRERLFTGYTNMGNRRYKEHTLDNVVREMKKELKDNNQTAMYGSGALRAQFAPQFRTLTDIKGARGRIGGDLDKEALDNRLYEISEKIGEYAKYKDDNPFIQGDIVRDNLVDISAGYSKWDDFFSGVPDDLKAEWGSYLDDLKNAPTDYFEAKPQRAVGLSEFSDALIPEGAPDDIADILSGHGLNVERYIDEADRARRMMAKENLLFQHPAATVLGGSIAAAILSGAITQDDIDALTF